MNKYTLSETINELYNMFNFMNKKYYNSELPEPIITIQKSKNCDGWCTVNKIWEQKETKDCLYEINISAHHLKSEILYIAETMAHEMVHLYHLMNGVNDCSGNIHNKKFKIQAEKVDLICGDRDKKYGYGLTGPSESFKQMVATFPTSMNSAFLYYRNEQVIPQLPNKKSIFKYVCPACGLIAKGKSGIKITCTECNKELIME